MQVGHFYHIHASGDWYGPVHDHVAAFHESGIPVEAMQVGFIGSKDDVREAEKFLNRRIPPRAWEKVAEAEKGYEQVTLKVLHQWVKEQDPGTPVLYMHTKGSYTVDAVNDRWRRSMTHELLTKWPARLEDIEGHDAVGSFWATPDNFFAKPPLQGPCFAGNFWWARAGFLAGLPPVEENSRWDAEQWLNKGNPDTVSLHDEGPDFRIKPGRL